MSRGYVLLTCLILLALLSVSSLLVVQTSTLMAQHTRLLDSAVQRSFQSSAQLRLVENALMRGETSVVKTDAVCESRWDTWIRIQHMDSEVIRWIDVSSEIQEAEKIIYALQACEGGRARIETSLAVLRPVDSPVPPDLKLGRLSWREVW